MPDEPRIVVVNATPLIALSLIDQLQLLRALYQSVLDQIGPFIERLRGGGIRLSSAVVEEALRLAGE